MKKLILLIIIIVVIVTNNAKCQDFGTRSREFMGLNILVGGVIGGIGSVVHKRDDQTRGNAFLNGFAKGCLGGSLTFAGKYMTYGITKHQNLAYAWPAKIVHAMGSSIMENAARNDKWYSNWAMDMGLIRVDISYKLKTMVRLQPVAVVGFVKSISYGYHLEIKNSLKIGTPYFTYENLWLNTNASTYANSICLNKASYYNIPMIHPIDLKTDNSFNCVAHEIIHTMQFREMLSINNIYLKNKNRWIYFDLPASDILYYINSYNNKQYYSNIYELEAESLSKII